MPTTSTLSMRKLFAGISVFSVSPKVIRFACRRKPVKISANKTSRMAHGINCLAKKPALKIQNSLKKTLKGGMPAMARTPKKNIVPRKAFLRKIPFTLLISLL